MGAVLPADAAPVDQSQIDLIDQGGRLERVARGLFPHVASGQPTQFRIDERNQLFEGRVGRLRPRPEEDQ